MTDEDPIVVKPSLKIIDFSGRIPEVAFYGSSILFKPDLEYLEEYEPERYDNSFSSYDKSGKHDLKAYPIKAWVIGFDTVHEIPIDESVDGISYISRGYSGGLLVKYRCKNREENGVNQITCGATKGKKCFAVATSVGLPLQLVLSMVQ